MNNPAPIFSKTILICLSTMMFFGCSSQKDNAANRGLQNLSARYNYIYNSNNLLDAYQTELSQTHQENYDGLLEVYIAPVQIDYSSNAATSINPKALDEIAQKAQTIVAEKNLSNYIDEAYLLLGKTNFYKGNYFTASEYFDYTSRAYKDVNSIKLQALNWKARSLMQLNSYEQAEKTLDTVVTLLDSVKKQKAEPLATLAQFNIYRSDYKKAISYLEGAIKESNGIQSRTRWPFILGQLHELEKDYDASLKNYTRVENSNAPFEMYFNAKLNKIRVNNLLQGKTFDRKQQLLRLLKDDKNLDYNDQIYYEVAEDYFADKDFTKAEEYYKLSATKSTVNQYQKGLTYLKLADLNFKNLGNYVNAKLYYDSAANTLPKTYRGYEAILKKSENLEYLTQRYEIIGTQDSLQMMAKLGIEDRTSRIEQLFEPKKELIINPKLGSNIRKSVNNERNEQPNGTFYFSNASSVSIGFSDFKRKWGNRALADNWRQSLKSSAQVTQQTQNSTIGNSSTSTPIDSIVVLDKAEKIKAYLALLPLNEESVTLSNQKIIDAYFEIAAFYQQVIGDQEEATKVYETLLGRFPNNNHLGEIYYSLYLGYMKTDPAAAEKYKSLVLSKYPNSLYAKTILDPSFSTKQNALDLAVNNLYNSVFASYEAKDFKVVIDGVNETNQRFPDNGLQAQFDYLKAIAIGRTSNVDNLLTAFNAIVAKYPTDQLINPLVKDHIDYINANLASFKARKIALVDFDGSEPRFIPNSTTVARKKPQPSKVLNPTIVVPKTVVPENPTIPITPPIVTVPVQVATPEAPNPVADQLFTKSESANYYYVIAISDVSVSASSSRFGVGQFNRGNFSGTGLKHQLEELEEDQLIFVGNFATLSEVTSYAEGITPQLPKIMKVTANSYRGFFITKENFERIKNRETLNRYVEFFKNNY